MIPNSWLFNLLQRNSSLVPCLQLGIATNGNEMTFGNEVRWGDPTHPNVIRKLQLMVCSEKLYRSWKLCIASQWLFNKLLRLDFINNTVFTQMLCGMWVSIWCARQTPSLVYDASLRLLIFMSLSHRSLKLTEIRVGLGWDALDSSCLKDVCVPSVSTLSVII